MTTAPAIRCADTERSYPEVHQRIERIASALVKADVKPGDMVGLLLWNCVEFLELSAGIAAAAALPVPLNWHLRASELAYMLADSGCRIVFAHSAAMGTLAEAIPEGVRVVEVAMSTGMSASLPRAITATAAPQHIPELEEWISGCTPTAPPRPGALGAAGLVYTSGSTGKPKAVVRNAMPASHGEQSAKVMAKTFQLEPTTPTLLPMPLYHSAPNIAAMVALHLGADITILPRFSPEGFLQAVQTQHIEQCQMVPTMFARLLDLPEDVRRSYDTSSLHTVIHTAGPCAPHIKRAMIDWLGPIIFEYYGSTELGLMAWATSTDWATHPGTVGKPLLDAQIKIIGRDGIELTVGEPGLIYVKPASFFSDFTYLDDDAKRRAMEAPSNKGFLTLGDVGYLNDDGFLFISDRSADMIISGGVNIYPIEIEAVIAAIPGVRDVVVIGIPDHEYGEAVAAHVDIAPDAHLDEEDIKTAVRNTLAGYKVPRLVVFDDNLPREESGKVFKRLLRERYWAPASWQV